MHIQYAGFRPLYQHTLPGYNCNLAMAVGDVDGDLSDEVVAEERVALPDHNLLYLAQCLTMSAEPVHVGNISGLNCSHSLSCGYTEHQMAGKASCEVPPYAVETS